MHLQECLQTYSGPEAPCRPSNLACHEILADVIATPPEPPQKLHEFFSDSSR